jgi:hypothetical protein
MPCKIKELQSHVPLVTPHCVGFPVMGQFEFSYATACKFHHEFYGVQAQLKDVHY